MLLLVLSALAAPLDNAIARDDGEAVASMLHTATDEAERVGREHGDGAAWLRQRLVELGLEQIRLRTTDGQTLMMCSSEPEVWCDDSDPRQCDVEPNISCLAPERLEGIACSSGRRRVRGGRVHGLEACLMRGELHFEPLLDPPAARPSSLLDYANNSPQGLTRGNEVTVGSDNALDALFGQGGSAQGHVYGAGPEANPSGGGGGRGSVDWGAPAYRVPERAMWDGSHEVEPSIRVANAKVTVTQQHLLASDGRRVRVFDVNTGREGTAIPLTGATDRRKVKGLCASPDGQRIGVALGAQGLDDAGGAYEVWRLGDTPTLEFAETKPWGAANCSFSADGIWFFVGTRQGVDVWDLRRKVKRRSIGAGSDGDLDQARLATATQDSALLVQRFDYRQSPPYWFESWTPEGGQGARVPLGVDDLALGTAWLDATAAVTDSGEVVIRDVSANRELARVPAIGLHVVGANGVFIVDGRHGPTAVSASGEVLGALRNGIGQTGSLAISADGQWVVEAAGGEVHRYRLER